MHLTKFEEQKLRDQYPTATEADWAKAEEASSRVGLMYDGRIPEGAYYREVEWALKKATGHV